MNYKTKWFPGGNENAEELVDEEVFRMFGDLLMAALDRRLQHWREETTRSCVALVVVVDQFSRHIFRHRRLSLEDPERTRADSYALEVATGLTLLPNWSLNLSMAEYVFSLMPFRHSATIEHLKMVMASIEEKGISEIWNNELLNRFRKQTIRRMQHLQDRAKVIF